ncbi:MAG: hypothetical protein ACM3X0_04735 [Bacteroidota bacterium]
MDKNCRSDIAAFPELFAGIEQFIAEQATGLRRAGLRIAVMLVPGSALLLFALGKIV